MNSILEQFTTAQMTAAIRGIALSLLGGLVTNGVLTEDERQVVSGLIATAFVLGYGIYKRRKNGLIATTSNVKGVEQIVTDEKTADKIPSVKVVSRRKPSPASPTPAN